MRGTKYDDGFGSFNRTQDHPAVAGVKSIMARIGRYFAIRRGRRQLREMPDHMLKDLGIGRDEIDYVTSNGRGLRSGAVRGDARRSASGEQSKFPGGGVSRKGPLWAYPSA